MVRSRPRFPSRREAALLAGALALSLTAAGAALGRDSLGLFAGWGAFRDPAVPRCYAIAMADPSPFKHEVQPYAAIGSWPRRGERNQVHFRLSRALRPTAQPVLTIGSQRLALTGNGADAWAQDRRMDAAIVAAMRSARTMRVASRDTHGRFFSDSYTLAGAATAMDAATLGCSTLR